MENELTNLCPVCIQKPAEFITECNHGYCIECLCKLKKCALCRKTFQKTLLCNEIKCKRQYTQPRFIMNENRTTTIRNTNANSSPYTSSPFNPRGIHPWHLKTRRLTINRHNRNIQQNNRISFNFLSFFRL